MGRRWKILAIIGLSVALIDQATKFLAVRNLTPGIKRAHLSALGKTTAAPEEQAEALKGLSLGQEVAYFYGTVKDPCAGGSFSCPTVGVIQGFWNWRYVQNDGAAWGLLARQDASVRVPFFIVISIAAIVFIFSFLRKLEENQLLMMVALSLVFGGAIGNFIDRLHLTYVIDFIDWYAGTTHWPTFNFADSGISTGVGLMVLQWIREWVAERKKKPEERRAT